MKPTKEIIGLRIISISDGTKVGVVKGIIINPQMKSLDFIFIDQAAEYFGAKVIAFTDILGIGEFAVTIPHLGVIQDVAQNTEAQSLLKQNIRVLGTEVLTKKGQLIGEVTEILIDVETGHIVTCLYETDDQMYEVKVEQVITLGKELLIVEGEPTAQDQRIMETRSKNQITIQNDTLNNIKEIDFVEDLDLVRTDEFTNDINLVRVDEFADDINLVRADEFTDDINLVRADEFTDDINLVRADESTDDINLVRADEFTDDINLVRADEFTDDINSAKKVNHIETVDYAEEKEFNLFEQRQLQYFIGKRVEKDIILDNTEILRAGERITPEIVTHIITRSTLMEVTSHLQKK